MHGARSCLDRPTARALARRDLVETSGCSPLLVEPFSAAGWAWVLVGAVAAGVAIWAVIAIRRRRRRFIVSRTKFTRGRGRRVGEGPGVPGHNRTTATTASGR